MQCAGFVESMPLAVLLGLGMLLRINYTSSAVYKSFSHSQFCICDSWSQRPVHNVSQSLTDLNPTQFPSAKNTLADPSSHFTPSGPSSNSGVHVHIRE